MCRCPGTGGATLTTTSLPPSSTSSLSLGFQAPWSRVASSAWLFRPRSWPLDWPRMAAVARTAAWYRRTGTAAPVGAPTAVDILASFPPVRGLVFGSTACGGSREVGVLLAQAASSSAQRQWRSLGDRSMLDARSFMISTLRSQVGFAAAVAHARLRLSRLELIGGSGRTAGRYASAARAFISPTAFEQARGVALGAGGGRVGFAGGGLF